MSSWDTVVWSPQHDAAGRQVQNYLQNNRGRAVLTSADAWRFAMCLLVDAEYNLRLCQQLKGGQIPLGENMVGADRWARNAAADAGGVWPARPEVGRFDALNQGAIPKQMYLAPSGFVRDVYRSSRETADEPTFQSFGAPDPWMGDWTTPLGPVNGGPLKLHSVGTSDAFRIAPLVVVVLGVVAVAAMAAAGYVGAEYVKRNVEVDAEKARAAAEANLKLQVAMAKMAAGQPVSLDALTVSTAQKEERALWAVPMVAGGAGVAVITAGVLAWRGRKKTP